MVSGIASDGLRRPLEVRVRNRVAVRVVRREPERLVDPRLELLGERVLQPVGLVVHLVDVDPERLARGRARAGGGGGSPRARPARPPASGRRRGRARGRRGRGRRASSPSRSRTPARPASRGRGRSWRPARRRPRACRSRGGSAGSRRSAASPAPWRECTEGSPPSRPRRPLVASPLRGRPCRPQPRPRRRVHVLGADDGSRRHARFPVRAGARGHPDAEPVGPRRPARGHRDLARRVPVRPGRLRPAPARRLDRLGLRPRRRRARAARSRRTSRRARSSSRAR